MLIQVVYIICIEKLYIRKYVVIICCDSGAIQDEN